MSFTRPWATALILCISLGLSACGGGGGSSTPNNANAGGSGPTPPPGTGEPTTPPPTTPPPGTGEPSTPPPSTPTTGLSFSPATLTFSAASPNAALPAEQVITATYNGTVSGNVRIVALSDGIPAPQPIESMTRFNGDNTPGQAIVRPISPDLLGPGTHTETVTVRACVDGGTVCATNQLPGNPQTFTVTYVIGAAPVPPAVVMPRLAVAGTPGRVIVRGPSLGATTTVHFGPHAATNVSVMSDTEVHASYPALGSGTYAVALNSGAIPFSGSILAMPPTNYSNDSVDLPAGSWGLTFLRYDAERGALLVGAYDSGPGTIPSRLWRFTHDGADWNVTDTVEMDGVQGAAVSPDGSRILATAYAGVVELSAQDLTVLRTTPRPTEPPIPVFGNIAVANNGLALIGAGALYYFSMADRTLTRSGDGRGVLGTMDGSLVLGGGPGVTSGQEMFNYDASSTLRSYYRIATDPPVPIMAMRHGDRMVIDPGSGFPSDLVVYSAQGDTPLGVLPGAQTIHEASLSIRLAEVNPQGTRAYALREDNTLHTFALDRPTVGGAFPEIGTPRTLVLPTLNSYRLIATMTPDGRTLFIGGNRGVLVIPTLD